MHVTLLMVMSVNGYSTNHATHSIYDWTSSEDQDLFFTAIKQHAIVVMGRKTFKAAQEKIVLTPGKQRIVMTRHPERYTHLTVPEQLTFTNKSPSELISYVTKQGYDKLLLVGGSQINTLFLKAKLISELHLTVEPYIFGNGTPLFSKFEKSMSLKLINMKRLNVRGTLHTTYRVVY